MSDCDEGSSVCSPVGRPLCSCSGPKAPNQLSELTPGPGDLEGRKTDLELEEKSHSQDCRSQAKVLPMEVVVEIPRKRDNS